MRTRRIIYITLGSVLVFLNLLIDIGTPLLQDANNESDDVSRIAYYIGTQFVAIIGLVFFVLAFTITLKIKRTEKNTLKNSIDEIGIN